MYLVTGGAGFIGAHVVKALSQRGDTVVFVDDFNNRYDPKLKETRVQELFLDVPIKPICIRGDIRNKELLHQIFKEYSISKVIHLAAWASVQPSIEDPYIYTEVNVDGTVNILEAARQHGVQNMVVASSSSVYGGITEVPFREDMNIMHPASPYAATKVATEVMCATWHNLYKMPITCLRFFTVYGPWGRPEMAIFKFTKAILEEELLEMRGKETERDFTYIDDIVQGITAALDKPRDFAVYNLGECDAVRLPRLIAALEKALGKKAKVKEVPLPPGDIPRTLADITRAQKELGYRPTTSIERGVNLFTDWYQNIYVHKFL